MGDGDCGETFKTGGTALLAALAAGIANSGSVVAVLHELENIVEGKMGGTLGGILGIFLVALTNSLQANAKKQSSHTQVWAASINTALNNLRRYTPAAVGDRTVMDVLIPFADQMGQTGSFDKGVETAVKAAEATKTMEPRLGRATYVGTQGKSELPPDPGAWGVMEVIRGLQA